MDKRNWLWKRKSSEKSPGGTDSSGSISSHSERYSDDQEAFKASPNNSTQSPEVTSKASVTSEEVNDSIKILTEKLSAALVNVSAKEDLVKQHSKVAEEAVAGWEKAENEVAVLKQQLEAAIQQTLLLEDRASHLDGALKECVRQLRQAKDHQEEKIREAILEKSREWEATKVELENQILLLQTEAEAAKALSSTVDPNIKMKMDSLERENKKLKLELVSRSEELEIRIIERDLSAQAAESASKQHLESIKKVAKLEAECRRLQAVARKSSSSYDQKSVSASSHYVDSLTDSQSDSGERLSSLDMDSHKLCTNSLSGKTVRKTIAGLLEIDIMDDFLEMERLAALSEKEIITTPNSVNSDKQYVEEENPLKAELEEMTHRMEELEVKLQNVEAEKDALEKALSASEDSLKESLGQLKEAESRIEELQKEINTVNESKELLEFQLIGMEVEARTVAVQVVTLKEEVEKEQELSAKMTFKCQELEDELRRKSQEIELHQISVSEAKPQVKQEDLEVAAGKLAECQKTIASLGRQLQSLATLEDFLIDTANLPGFSGGGLLIPGSGGGELWKLHSNETFKTKNSSDPPQLPVKNAGPMVTGIDKELSASSSSSSSTSSNTVGSSRRRNGLEKLFSRSKSGKLENQLQA